MTDDAEAIAYLVDTGLPRDVATDLVAQGIPRDRLAALRIAGTRRVPLAQALADQGLDAGSMAPALEALGFPTDALTADETRALALYHAARELFGDEATARFGRVVNSAMARVAESALTMFGVQVEDPLVLRRATPLDRARAVDEGLARLAVVPELFEVLFRRQVLLAVARQTASLRGDGLHQVATLTVGFADLVSSTAWIRAQTPRQIADAVGLLERLAQNALQPGCRIVKMIGDEIMFVAPSPAAGCRSGLAMIAAVGAEPRLPDLRVGIAHGEVVPADGDLHGPVVNLAARLTAAATSGQVWLDPIAAAAVRSEIPLADLPPRVLAGFDEPVTASTPRAEPQHAAPGERGVAHAPPAATDTVRSHAAEPRHPSDGTVF